jgi:chromosome segregation ATPase
MTHTEHVLIGLLVGGAFVLWRVASDGLAQLATLRSSRNEIDQAVAGTERDQAAADEEIEELRSDLGASVVELEALTQEYDRLQRSRKK